MFQAEAADGLDGDADGFHDFAELVERAGHALTAGGNAAALIVADVVDDVVAAEIFEAPRPVDHVLAGHVVAHDFDAEIAAGLDDAFDGFIMRAGHDDDVSGTGFSHHFGFEIAAVHGFEVGDDGNAGEVLTQRANAVETFGKDERSAGFQPVHAGAQGGGGGGEGFVDVCQVERDLNDGLHGMKIEREGNYTLPRKESQSARSMRRFI